MNLVRTLLSLVSILLVLTKAQSLARTRVQVWRRETSSFEQSQANPNASLALQSPSPEDYNDLYNFACSVDKNGSTTPIGHDELVKHYADSGSYRLKQVVERFDTNKECRREPASWRFRYIEESGFVHLNERSVDERAANVLYLIRAVKPFSVDVFSYNWEDPELDKLNMDRVAGPKFDDDLCGEQINQMLELAHELNEIARSRRSNSTRSSTSPDRKLTDRHISLAKILDSFGRHDSGRLMGKIYMPGSYNQCLWNKLILGENDTTNMRFCWAHLSYERHLAESLRLRQRSVYEHPLNVLYVGICLPESCHSKSFARHKNALQKLVDSQFEQPSIYVDEHLNMTSLYCLVDEDGDFRIPLAGKLLLAFIFGWCLTTIFVSIYNSIVGLSAIWQEQRQLAKANESKRARELEHPVLRSLDLYESWQDFQEYYSKPSRDRPVQLDAMNFFKVFGCAFVVVGHTMCLFLGLSMDEIRTARYIETDAVVGLIVAGTLVVDTFFVISGILWAYFALKTLKKLNSVRKKPKEADGMQLQANMSIAKPSIVIGQADGLGSKQTDEGLLFSSSKASEKPATEEESANQADPAVTIIRLESWPETIKTFFQRWLFFSLARYLRIVPLFVLIHWFKKYVFVYVGGGPFWDHGLNYQSMAGACHKESPLTPFTFLSAYYPISRQCTLQSWSVSNDVFFALVAPPMILLINRRPKVAAWLTLISGSLSYYFAMDKLTSFPAHVDEELRELRSFGFYRLFDEASIIYTAPHLRIFCFLTGVWGGYVLYCSQDQLDKQPARCEGQKHHESDETGQDRVCVELLSPIVGRRASLGEAAPARIEWPRWLRFATYPSSFYMFSIFFCFGLNENMKNFTSPYHRAIYPQFTTSLRLIWALANVTLLMRMMTDWKDSLLMRWSASKFWQTCSKLCLPVLLIHLDVLLLTIHLQPSLPTSFTKLTFFNLGTGILMICIPLAIIIHVIFEMPFDKLIRSGFSEV